MTMIRFSISNRQITKGRRYHGQHVNEHAKTGDVVSFSGRF